MATVFERLWSTPAQTKQEGTKKILFAKVPDAENLCCIVAWYEESDKPTTSMYSFYQWTALKCRRLIFTIPELIATPELGGLHNIYIIVSKEFYSLNKLQPVLKKNGLHFARPTYVVKNTYEACLRYTITARIAPSWNVVENYFVQGRDFIVANDPLNAVRLDVIVLGDQLQLVMWPARVCLSPVVFNAFHLTESQEDPENQVLDIEAYNIKVFVLPSMKPAMATYLQTKLPENSPFKTYKDIRRYWKNIYGFRLPENGEQEQKIIYVTIKFNKLQPGLTYPIVCLRSCPLITIKPRNESDILMGLLLDLTVKMPNICGFPLASNAYIGIAVNKLFPSSLISENPDIISSVPLGNLTRLHPIFLSNNSNNSSGNSSNNNNNKPVASKEEESKKKINAVQISWPANTTATTSVTSTVITSNSTSSISVSQCYQYASSSTLSTSSSVTRSSTQLPEQYRNVFNNLDKKKSNEQFRKPTQVFHNYNSELNSAENLSRPKLAPIFYPRPRSAVKPAATVTSSYFNSQLTAKSNETISLSQYSQQILSKPTPFMSNSLHHGSSAKETSITMSSLLKRETCSMKTYESGVKKRSRPQVQLDVDVSAMARSSEGLARVNTTTLIAYLRAQGIPCKVKDKKGDLVAKVMAHLKNEN